MRITRCCVWILIAGTAAPAVAQQAVSALPRTNVTWNNRTASYQLGAAIAYSGDIDAYAPARVVRGVPNNYMSYVVTQGNAGPNDYLTSVAFRPAAGAAPAQFLFPTTPAGQANTSLGGMISSFGWGAADVVMNQCYAGGFAYNVAGSLQGATSAAGAVVPPVNRIGYTFASGANYNELAYGFALPSGAAGPATMTALGDFTQGQAYGSTTSGAAAAYSLVRSYRNGRVADPFVVGGSPYGVPNQVPTLPGPPARANLQAGGFESPIYGSADALTAAGGIDEAGANNSRSYATNTANRWAVLVAFTPDRSEFSLDLQRQYAALLSNGIARNHIIVLQGDGSAGALARFTALAAANNHPDVNGILNTVGAAFQVPVNGAASNANVAGLLNPTTIHNPAAPPAARMSFWQALSGSGVAGPRPAAGDSLLLYTTGHGSAVNIFGAELTAANRPVGNVFRTDFKIIGPANVQIIPGTDIHAQITVRGMPIGFAGTTAFSINGVDVGAGTLAAVQPGSALDMSAFAADGGQGFLSYVDLAIPAESFLAMGGYGASTFDLWASNADPTAVEEFERSFAAFTFLDGDLSGCGVGSCNLHTSLVGQIPEPATWALLLAGAAVVGVASARRRRTHPDAARDQHCA